jgi:hypothetical protein
MVQIKMDVQQITLAKALKVKNRLAGRLAKVHADSQTYNSVLEGQADQVNVAALVQTRDELVEALVTLKAAISEANREIQRAIYDLAEKKASAQFFAGISTRHGAEPAVYPGQPDHKYLAVMKKADVDAQVQRLEKEIDTLQDQIDSFNHRTTVDVDGRILELAS